MNLRPLFLSLPCTVLISMSVVGSGIAAPVSEYSFNWFSNESHKHMITKELSQLSNHDVVLIIDKSRSMLITDCFSEFTDDITNQISTPASRWQWCHDQTRQLAQKTRIVFPEGLTNDSRAIYWLKKLKNGLLDQNAKFKILDFISFSELNKIGLSQALIDVTTVHSDIETKESFVHRCL